MGCPPRLVPQLLGQRLFLRPSNRDVERVAREHPEESAEARRALAALNGE